MRYFHLLPLMAVFVASAQNPPENSSPSIEELAQTALKKAFQNNCEQAVQIKIRQELFLTSIQKSIVSYGVLSMKGRKFKLELKGEPSSLSVFDGNFLWHQADTSEKTVFQLTNHPQIQTLTDFFESTSFSEGFQIKQVQQFNKSYVLELAPKKNIKGLKTVFMRVDSYISQLRMIWKDLSNWQKLDLEKPECKGLSDSFFQFSSTGFQIITSP